MIAELFGPDGLIEILSIIIYFLGMVFFLQGCVSFLKNSTVPGAKQFGISILVFLALAIISVFLEDTSDDAVIYVAIIDCIGSLFFVSAALGIRKLATNINASS